MIVSEQLETRLYSEDCSYDRAKELTIKTINGQIQQIRSEMHGAWIRNKDCDQSDCLQAISHLKRLRAELLNEIEEKRNLGQRLKFNTSISITGI